MRGGSKHGFIQWALAIAVYTLTAALVLWSHLLAQGYSIRGYERHISQVIEDALSADYSEALWGNAKTIEEAWPEVVKEQEVPFYYAQLQKAAELHDKVGYSDHPARLKPHDELTRSERLLLARQVPAVASEWSVFYNGPFVDFTMLHALTVLSWRLRDGNAKPPERELAESAVQTSSLYSAAERKSAATAIALRVGSPIARAPIKLSEDFSPGNAYCELADERVDRLGVYEADESFRDYHYPYEQERFHYLYFRIYGESDVIAEGLWGWRRGY